jgi:phosphohistidine phosphatase
MEPISMRLYLIRHGEAVPSSPDTQRILSAHGQEEVLHLAAHLQQENPAPQHIYHSGILRAVQTAEIIAQTWGKGVSPAALENFLPEDDPREMYNKINTWTEDTVLVGHLPYLSYLLRLLSEEGHYITFDTATAVCLEQVSAKWLIQGVWHP